MRGAARRSDPTIRGAGQRANAIATAVDPTIRGAAQRSVSTAMTVDQTMRGTAQMTVGSAVAVDQAVSGTVPRTASTAVRISATPILPRPHPQESNHPVTAPASVHLQLPDLWHRRREIELEELRKSHAELAARVDNLANDVRASNSSVHAARMAVSSSTASFNARVLRRVSHFAKSCAIRLLQSGSSEMKKSGLNLSPGSSVRQVILRSEGTDCTLLEFQLLCAASVSNPAIRCTIYPSQYYASFPSVRRTSRMEISFNSYYDICEALQIDVLEREKGLYRERKTFGRILKCLQIMGVNCVRKRQGENDDRVILIGRSLPIKNWDAEIPVLLQRSLEWSENTWETGLEFSMQPPNSLLPTVTNVLSCDGAQRTSDINCVAPEHRSFSMYWEKLPGSCSDSETNSEFVLGTLYSSFPAVILRSRILTLSAQEAFSRRFNGRFTQANQSSSPPESWILQTQF